MYHSIQHHDGEERRQVHVRVPEERARPFLRLIVPQAYREVDQPTTPISFFASPSACSISSDFVGAQ
ncbi:MAG: hypothetical protein E6I80_13615 [Chloroflexi bacterium]|nr:MAG: hypothetical protein E6I80_13615 [Chloroflexota bacterium]